MLTTKVRVQVLAFVVIALATTAFVGANYAGIGRLFGNSGYTVKLELSEGGGLFTNGEVTYRGVKEVANRSSLWSRHAGGWRIRFHQVTPA